MKVIRRIFGNIDTREKKILIENALKIRIDDGYFNHDLDADSTEYKNIKKLVCSLNLQDDIIGTEFTEQETEEAKILVFRGIWATGYPQPKDTIKFSNNTYVNSCPNCGIHGEQKAPFQMEEPKLGKHKIMQLNWINDEIFVERDLYEKLFKNFGIEMREALLYKKNVPVRSVIQLNIPKAKFEFNMNEIEFSICPICAQKKYSPVVNGFFPTPIESNFHIIRTREYFGSGHSAFNKILLSHELMDTMIKDRLAKYYHFEPTK